MNFKTYKINSDIYNRTSILKKKKNSLYLYTTVQIIVKTLKTSRRLHLSFSWSKLKFHNPPASSWIPKKEMASSPPSEESQNQNQDRQQVAAVKEQEKECLHKTKTIEFLGRTTPIVLQNDNGPCPLLAICNHFLSPSCSFVHLVFFLFLRKWKECF